MNIQPISAVNVYKRNNNTNLKQNSPVAFQGETKSDDTRLTNALKALALSSAIAFTPAAVTSCDTDEIDSCDHPNHIDRPTNDSTTVKPDTIYTGKTFVIPEFTMPRYKVDDADTTYFGNVTFSPGIVHVPFNAHKSSELKTVSNFIDYLGLKTKNIDKEYVASKSFAYNTIPAQIAWVDERTGSVNQLKYNGYDSKDNFTKMDLITISKNNALVQQQLQLTSAGSDKLLVSVYDKNGENKITEYLFAYAHNTLTQFEINDEGKFIQTYEYCTSDNNKSVIRTDNDGEISQLSSFDILTAISEDKE